MGLGKTSITLTALNDLLFDNFEVHRVLVIAPLRVARDTWPAEIQKWNHLSLLTYAVAVGTETERKAALLQQTDICIINRENVQWLIEDSGVPFDFDTVVVDELSSFKSYQTKRFRALMKVRPCVRRIVGLTGTPSANGLMDLWAEYRLLDMGQRLGRFIGQYRTNYFMPDKRNGQIIYSYKPLPSAEKAIYSKIADITISMKSTDHLQMPELVSSEYEVQLSEEEQERYDDLKDNLVLQLPDGDITVANAAALSNKLSQMSNGAVYDDVGDTIHIHDRKLDALEDLIEAANGKPVLVAYWFKHDLARISERLHKLHIPFSQLDTPESIRRWNAGELPVALVHPASAGHGLNLFLVGLLLLLGTPFRARTVENSLLQIGLANRYGYAPALISCKRIKNTQVSVQVSVMEFYSLGVAMEIWETHRTEIQDALNVHFVEPIKYGGRNGRNRIIIVITAAPGAETQRKDVLYDEF
ncbi:SNF2-related protein [Caproiciproducens sp.]